MNNHGCDAIVVTCIDHTQDLTNAKAKIKEKYPDLALETYYLHLDGTFEPMEN